MAVRNTDIFPQQSMSKERFVKNWKCFIQSLQIDLGQTGSNKWKLKWDPRMIFLHHSAFNHPGRVMMLIMIFICYIPGSLQKQRQDKLCSERIVLVLRIR